MDLLALQRPELHKLRQAQIQFDPITNKVHIVYRNLIADSTKIVTTTISPTIASNPTFYVLYNVSNNSVSAFTELTTFNVTDNNVDINDNTYNLANIVLFKVSRIDSSSASGIDEILTDLNNLQTSLNNLQTSHNELSNTVNTLQTNLSNLQTSHNNLSNTVNTLQTNLSSLQTSYNQLPDVVDELYARVTDLEAITWGGYAYYSCSMWAQDTFPSNPYDRYLVWRTDQLKLYRYVAQLDDWVEIDWKSIVRTSSDWEAGRLRINSSTGMLEITPDGSNWFECIPAVGSKVIVLQTVDNAFFSYKYWIAPGQKIIINSLSNHIPVIMPNPSRFRIELKAFNGQYSNEYYWFIFIGNTATTAYYTDDRYEPNPTAYPGHKIGRVDYNGQYYSTVVATLRRNADSISITGSNTWTVSNNSPITINFTSYSDNIPTAYWIGTNRYSNYYYTTYNIGSFYHAYITRQSY